MIAHLSFLLWRSRVWIFVLLDFSVDVQRERETSDLGTTDLDLWTSFGSEHILIWQDNAAVDGERGAGNVAIGGIA